MKIRFICCLATVLILGGYNAYASHISDGQDLVKKLESTQDLYTAYNLYAFRDRVHAINYKHGTLIPAGTKIKRIYIKSWYLGKEIYFDFQKDKVRFAGTYGMTSRNDNALTFVTDHNNKKYRYIFRYRFHTGKSFEGYFNAVLSTKNFSQQTEGFDEEVIAAIRKGVVIEGMTREQVIMSMGYPPEHKTPNIDSAEWLYWMDKEKTKKICFNFEGLAIECGSPADRSLTSSTANQKPPTSSSTDTQPQDINSRFETLRKLFENGLISEEDYNQKKSEILKDL